ncbi:glycosyltransferase [Lysobacter sp. S4-A87]|uniref:glycosyltransferase n=1 Tax=Lysobacter sp. S4-A87 TaxID=2925843 RepID=UPI001F532211|nr:glycosyltransferase [Lysobacter sp. S4-A87]UNK49667.1 glycosyltransferase [Lysobacter sp. S4-A87]
MRVLHVFYQSLPDAKGASIRGRDIVESQLGAGLSPKVVTCPFQAPSVAGSAVDTIGGVEYVRTYNQDARAKVGEESRSLFTRVRKLMSVIPFARSVMRVARAHQADVVHAHSMFYCGLAGWYAARRSGVPFVYEVRSLWEQRSHIRNSFVGRVQSDVARFAETLVARLSDSVVTISEGLEDDLVSRGIPRDKIVVVPNAVNFGRVPLLDPSRYARTSDVVTFGYIGNLSEIEGLNLLLNAASLLHDEGMSLRVVVVGDGPARNDLVSQASRMPTGLVEIRAPILPDEVGAAYTALDVVVIPRLSTYLTNRVTPLKPLEAAAYGRALILSKLDPMVELMGEAGGCCLYFEPGNVDALAQQMRMVIAGSRDLDELSRRAHSHVLKWRSWEANSKTYRQLYESLLRRQPQ